MNKRVIIVITLVLSLALPLVLLNELSKKRDALYKAESGYNKFSDLIGEYVITKEASEEYKSKIDISNYKGALHVIEEITKSLAIKEKVSSLKPGDQKRVGDYIEETAFLRIDNLDLNSIVGLLYKIDTLPACLLIKTFKLKKDFEAQNSFDLSMDISFIKRTE